MTFEWVRDHLLATGKQPGLPATAKAFQAFQDAHGWTLPQEVRDEYSVMNGADYSTDEKTSWIRFWPLGEWRNVKANFPNDAVAQSAFDGTFVIADYAIECVFYVLCMNHASPAYGSVSALGAKRLSPISSTFRGFLRLVTEDNDALHNYS